MDVPWQMSTIAMHDAVGCEDYYELHPQLPHEPGHVLFVQVTTEPDADVLVVGYGAHVDDQNKRTRLPFKTDGTTLVRHSIVAIDPYGDGAPRKRELWVGTVSKRAHGIFAIKLSRPARIDVQLCEANPGTTVEEYEQSREGLAELKRRARARAEARLEAGLP